MLSVPWRVVVAGRDMTSRMNRYIQSIEATDKAGESSDTASLVFDDQDGRCIMPPKKSPIEIYLRNVKVFEGVTDSTESSGARGEGMELTVTCTGVDKSGKAKERQHRHKDDATLKDFLGEVAKEAGFEGITVDPSFASIKRAYWTTRGRSFLQLGQDLADELGGTFKIRGGKAVLAKRGAGGTPGGATMGTVRAVRGDNLLRWRLQPFETKPRYKRSRVRWYNRKKATYEQEDVEIGAAPGGADVTDFDVAPRAGKDQAKGAANGRKTASEREGGSGEVVVLLAVEAWAEGACEVVGVRAGISGSYRIESRTHRVTRDGAETSMSVKQPQAGDDTRAAG